MTKKELETFSQMTDEELNNLLEKLRNENRKIFNEIHKVENYIKRKQLKLIKSLENKYVKVKGIYNNDYMLMVIDKIDGQDDVIGHGVMKWTDNNLTSLDFDNYIVLENFTLDDFTFEELSQEEYEKEIIKILQECKVMVM